MADQQHTGQEPDTQSAEATLRRLRESMAPGTRVVHGEGGHKGTVRAVEAMKRRGAVSVMIGVEWDEAKGMHDGTANGRRYFSCADKHGSFVAPQKVHAEAGLDEVLVQRFTDDFAAVVNKVNTVENLMSKDPSVRDDDGRFPNVWNVDCAASPSLACVASCGPRLGSLFPNIRRLAIPNALLRDWGEVAAIAAALPQLETFSVRGNALGPIEPARLEALRRSSPRGLAVLNAADTGLTNPCVGHLLATLPQLAELHVGANPIDGSPFFEDPAVAADANLHTLGLERTRLRSLDDAASAVGPALRSRLKSLNLNHAGVTCFRGISAFPALERLMARESSLAHWDALLPLHDDAPQLRHLCFSSDTLDGQLDTGTLRRQHVVAMLPEHVSHLNLSFIRESEWRAARQAIMTRYVRERADAQGEDVDPSVVAEAAGVPEVVRRLIKEQEAEGVKIFVPKPRYIELTLQLRLHLLFCGADAFRGHAREYFASVVRLASTPEAERRRSFMDGGSGLMQATPHAIGIAFETPIRQSVGSLRRAVAAKLTSDDCDALHHVGARTGTAASDIASTILESVGSGDSQQGTEGATDAEPTSGVLLLFHLDEELLENPGAVARGFHCNELFPDRPPVHNWRVKSGDHLVAAFVTDGTANGFSTAWRSHVK